MSEAIPTQVDSIDLYDPCAAYRPPRMPAANEAAEQQNGPTYAWLKRAWLPSGIGADLARLGLLTAVYVLVGKLSLLLASVHPSATAVWPPTGLALAALLVLGMRVWPGIMLGAFLVNLTTAGSLATSLGIACGNTLEGLVGAALVHRFAHGRQAFEHPQDILMFALCIVGPSTMLSATVGVSSLALGGFAPWASYGAIWLTWWLGDAMGGLIFTPLLLTWTANRRLGWTGAQRLEGALLLVLLCVVGQLVFTGWSATVVLHLPLEFMCLPPLLLIAVRFSQREAATAVALLSGIAIWGTLQGFGPFVRAVPNESLLLLQAFMGTMALTSMLLGAALAQRQRGQAVLEQQRREAAVLTELVQTINASLDLDTVLQLIVEGARNLCRSDTAAIGLKHADSQTVVIRHRAGYCYDQEYGAVYVQPGEGLGGQVLVHGLPVRTTHYAADPRIMQGAMITVVRVEQMMAMMVVPIRMGGRVEGLLYVGNRSPQPFTDDDEAILLRLAEHTAIAIHNARLYTQVEQRQSELRTLLEINKQIGRTSAVVPLLSTIAREAARLLDVPVAMVRQREGDDLVLASFWGDAVEMTLRPRLKIGQHLSGLVAASRQPVIVDDVSHNDRITPESLAFRLRYGLLAYLGVPLIAGDEIVGILTFHGRQGHSFAPADVEMAMAFADQAAIAIHNAHLFADAERRRQIAESLTEISSRLSQSLNPGEVGQWIVESVKTLLQTHASILFWQDPDAKELTVLAVTDSPGPFFRSRTLPQGTGLVGLAMREGRPLVTPNVLTDSRVHFPPEVRTALLHTSYRAILAVPLIRHAQAIGALSVVDREGRSFTQEEIRVAQTFAEQAATALENARLFEEVRISRERLQALSRQLLEAQESERRRLAHELHDEIGQLLTAVQLNLEAGQRSTEAPVPRQFFRDSIEAIQHVQQQVRTLAIELRPSMLDYLGLVPALRWYADQQSQRSGVVMRVIVASAELRVPHHLETVCFRVVQEALTNVMRHAQAHQVCIEIQQHDGDLDLCIRDDGVGFDVAAAQTRARQGGSVGILGMQERVQLAGGQLQIVSEAAQGTTLRAHLPLSSSLPIDLSSA